MAEFLLEQISTAQDANLLKQKRNLDKFGMVALSGLGVSSLIGVGAIIYFILKKLIFSGTNTQINAGGYVLLSFLVFAVLSLIYVIYSKVLEEKRKNSNLNNSKNLTEAEYSSPFLAQGNFEPVPSVTENTTELLLVENKTRKIK